MDLESVENLRKPTPYKPIAQLPISATVEDGWGVPVVVPKGALYELETNYSDLIQKNHELKGQLRKVLKEPTATEKKIRTRRDTLRLMTGVQKYSSKRQKPFVDPAIWSQLEQPVQEALRGLYGLAKHEGLVKRCKTIMGVLHLVGDGHLVKLLKAKHLTECRFSNQLILFKVCTVWSN